MWMTLLVLAATFGQGYAPAGAPQGYERQVFEAVNRTRADAGLPRLAWDDAIARAARAHSERMRDARFFAHQDPEFGGIADRLSRAGIHWATASENIFQARGYSQPAAEAVKAWLASPPHRRNILDRRHTRTGVGIATAPDGTYRFTQIYLRP
ncbi:MAG TPA: CAP domain-containing protein [Bryobacteraceae bacterium]|nr:CAP domain-containing protein [Bryobacteraceae bacterium]